MIKLNTVLPNPNNPRTVNDDKFKKLVQSIKDFPKMLELRPIVVDENNIALGGNMRLKALKKLGYTEIPNNWIKRASELTDDEKRQFIIKDNVGFGDWEWDLLRADWDIDELGDWGLDLPELEEDEHIEAVEDDYSEPDNMQVDVVLGDLIEIGAHRLLCGDSTDSDAVAKLMDGEKEALVFTDPPYGISVVNSTIGGSKAFGTVGGSNKIEVNQYEEIIGDDTTQTAKDFHSTCVAYGFENMIIWGGNYFTDFLPPSKGWIVWDKKGREWNDNFSDFELAWSSFDKVAKIFTHVWMGMVQSGKREKRVHPTQKPSQLIIDCIMFYDKTCKSIFDGFLGSGATMVAAHEMGKKCYGMELAPNYCQVIIDRMLKLDSSLVVKINGEVYKTQQNPTQ